MSLDFSNITKWFKDSVSSKGTKSVIGLDIGSSSINAVQIHNNKGVPTLDTYGELQLGPYADLEVGQPTNLPIPSLVQAFVDIARESSMTTKEVSLAISYNASFATVITLPTTNADELAHMVPVAAKKYIPVSLNTVTLDWFPIGLSTSESGQNGTRVLLVAIHNDGLKRSRGVVINAGFETKQTEIEIFSLVRSSMMKGDGTVAIIDFGARGTRLYLAHAGLVLKTHSLQMSSTEVTQTIAKTLDIGFMEAEQLKRAGYSSNDQAKHAVENLLTRGIRELHQVVRQQETMNDFKVDKVILCGSGALLEGLQFSVQDIFGVPATLADPFSKLAYPVFLEDTLKEAGPSFAVSVGAALQNFVSKQ